MSHIVQLGILISIGSILCVVLYRWKDEHPADCICQRCREKSSDRYIDELIAERERKNREAQIVSLDDYRWGRRHG